LSLEFPRRLALHINLAADMDCSRSMSVCAEPPPPPPKHKHLPDSDQFTEAYQDTYIFQMEEDIARQSEPPKHGGLGSGELTPLNGTTSTASGAVTPAPAVRSSHPMAAEAHIDSLRTRMMKVAAALDEEPGAWPRKSSTENERSNESEKINENKEDGQKT
jgi:hypothetical protein